MYNKEEDIIHFVFVAFNGLFRKKENINLAFHSIMVGIILKNAGMSDKIVNIGYLHDIIEDTKYTYDDLLNMYGKDIADGVRLLSEDKTISDYLERKRKFINSLKNCDDDILIVEVADKLQNLLSDYDNYKRYGKQCLITEANNYEELKWYYNELGKLFNERLNNNELLERYNNVCKEYFS